MNFLEKKFGLKKENTKIVLLVVLSLIIFYGMFLFYPIIKGMIGSFYDWTPLTGGKFEFIGLENYRNLIKQDAFWISLRNTLIFTMVIVITRVILGILIAEGINSVKFFKSFFRTAYFLPVITALTAISLVWNLIYDPKVGIINGFLSFIGVNTIGLLWLKSEKTALLSIIIMSIWRDVGFAVVLYLAGLSTISKNYYEAAQIDGAKPLQVLRYIKLPLLKQTTTFVVLTGTIWSLQVFTQVFYMTQGGPGSATSTVVYLVYMEAFQNWRFGYASAITQVLFVIILIISLIQFYIMRKGWNI